MARNLKIKIKMATYLLVKPNIRFFPSIIFCGEAAKKNKYRWFKVVGFGGGGLVGSKKSVTCPVSGVTKGFACNTPQSSRRHVNVHVHSQYLRKVIQFRNNSRSIGVMCRKKLFEL